MTKMHKRLTSTFPTSNASNNNDALVFPPLTYSRWTQWLLKDTSEDCIIHQHQGVGPSSSSNSPSRKTSQSSSSNPSSTQQHHHHHSSNHQKRNNMELIQLLAINALEFTAPVYSFLNKAPETSQPPVAATSSSEKKKTSLSSSSPPPLSPTPQSLPVVSLEQEEAEEQKKRQQELLLLTKKTSTELKLEREFIQLSGHQGTFAPAGPKSLWKKMPPDLQEANIYTHLKTTPGDPFVKYIPHFISKTNYNNTDFIELEDLITRFDLKTLSIMDIKLGTRTFLESEVSNIKPRSDLFDKMYKIDPSAFTEEELSAKSVTKLRYMQFREKLSSTTDLGFRIEGVKLSGDDQIDVNFQRLKDESTISCILTRFCSKFKFDLKQKLIQLRSCLESSEFFKTHEMIGSSLLLIHDHLQCGCWIIDFAKTFKCCDDVSNTLDRHRTTWELGNRADGVLTGMDNLIRLMD